MTHSTASSRRQPRQARRASPREMPIKIDDDGVGRAVLSFWWQDGYGAAPVGAGTTPAQPQRYPRQRDELWGKNRDLPGDYSSPKPPGRGRHAA